MRRGSLDRTGAERQRHAADGADQLDAYHFAIIHDPEDNPIGLITPFNN